MITVTHYNVFGFHCLMHGVQIVGQKKLQLKGPTGQNAIFLGPAGLTITGPGKMNLPEN